MDRGRKGKLCKDVREHVVGGAPDELDGALLDEVANVVIFNVDVLGLRGCHVVGSQGDTTLVVLEGSGWASEGRANCGKELAKEYNFLRGAARAVYSASEVERATLLKVCCTRRHDHPTS